MDLSKYRQLFLDECREHLQVMNRELLRLEQEGETGGVDALFRAAHSIKGMSGLDGVRRRRGGQPRPRGHSRPPAQEDARGRSPALMTLLYEGVDSLGTLVTEVEEKGTTHLEIAGLAARLRAASRREPADAEPSRPSRGAVASSRRRGARRARRARRDPTDETPGTPEILGAAGSAGQSPALSPDGSAPAAGETANGAAAPPPPPEEDLGADLVAARGGIFSLEPEKLAMVRDFVRSGLVPYACQLRVSKDSAALCARNFIILGRLAKAGMVLASSPTIEEVRAGTGRELVEALLLTERAGGPAPRRSCWRSRSSRSCSCRRLRIGGGERAPGAAAARAGADPARAARDDDRPAGGPGAGSRGPLRAEEGLDGAGRHPGARRPDQHRRRDAHHARAAPGDRPRPGERGAASQPRSPARAGARLPGHDHDGAHDAPRAGHRPAAADRARPRPPVRESRWPSRSWARTSSWTARSSRSSTTC